MVEASTEAEKNIDWKDKTAFLISAVFSPFVIIPFFIVIVVSAFATTRKEFYTFTAIGLFFSTIVPLLNAVIAVKLGKITDIHVAVREERKEPFIVALLSIAVCTVVLYLIQAPPELVKLGVVMIFNGMLFFLITMFWKISMHSSILAGVLISLSILVNNWFLAGFAVIPFLIWARIRRDRHNIYQGIIACILAAGVTYFIFYLFSLTRFG